MANVDSTRRREAGLIVVSRQQRSCGSLAHGLRQSPSA